MTRVRALIPDEIERVERVENKIDILKKKKEKNFLRKFIVIAEENSIESSGKFMGLATFFYIDPIARDPQSVI